VRRRTGFYRPFIGLRLHEVFDLLVYDMLFSNSQDGLVGDSVV
jgi:hypothetical protein